MGYVGRPVQREGSYEKLDAFGFNGSLTTFTLSVGGGARNVTPGKAANLRVVVNDITLEPEVDYVVSGDEIIFTTTYAGGTSHHAVMLGDSYKAPATVPTDLNSLSNVTISAPAVDHVLKWNGSQWVNDGTIGTTHIENLDGVTITSKAEGDVLMWDISAWVNTPLSLDSLIDTNLRPPLLDGAMVIYQESTSEWINLPYRLMYALDVDPNLETNIADGEIMVWDNTNFYWTNSQIPSSMDDLSDVDTSTTAPSNGDGLIWDGSNWIPTSLGGGSPHALTDHTNINAGTPNVNDVLSWDGSNWVAVAPSGGGATTLDELTDVDTTGATSGQSLAFNGSIWTPQTISGGGGATIDEEISIYVSGTGDDGTGDGSQGTPYATVSHAATQLANVFATKQINILCDPDNPITETALIRINHQSKIVLTSYTGVSATINFEGVYNDPAYNDDGVGSSYTMIQISSNLKIEDINLVKSDLLTQGGDYAEAMHQAFAFFDDAQLFLYDVDINNVSTFTEMRSENKLKSLRVELSSMTLQSCPGFGSEGSKIHECKDLHFGRKNERYGSGTGDDFLISGGDITVNPVNQWYRVFEFEDCVGEINIEFSNRFDMNHANHRVCVLRRCTLTAFKLLFRDNVFNQGLAYPGIVLDVYDSSINMFSYLGGQNLTESRPIRMRGSKVLMGGIEVYEPNIFNNNPYLDLYNGCSVHLQYIMSTGGPSGGYIARASLNSQLFIENVWNAGLFSTNPSYTSGLTASPSYNNMNSYIWVANNSGTVPGSASGYSSQVINAGGGSGSGEG